MKLGKFLKSSALVTAVGIVIFLVMLGYYYFTTPKTAVVISCDDFPASLSLRFSPDTLIDHVASHLEDMIATADSGVVNELGRREGLGPRPVPQKVLPIRATSSVPSPVFSQKVKGMDLNLARRLGIYLRTSRLLELRVIGTGQNGWRLIASMKDQPKYSSKGTVSAPRGGGECSDLESCANELAEQALRLLDYQRLLNYYLKLDTENGNRQVLDLYQNAVPPASLVADDLVAWGNVFSGLHRYDDALQKYQEALAKDETYCPARVARGFLYSGRPHGTQLLADLKQAEDDFRRGIECNPKNKFAQTNLCNTLIREWANNLTHDPQLLTEARTHCDKALEEDPRFVVAAVNVAYCLYRQDKRQDSLAYFERISQQYPTDNALFANYGYLLYLEFLAGNKNALQGAIEKTKHAFTLNSESYVTANNLGFFYYEQQDYDQALDYWKKADPLRGNDVDSTAGLSLAFFKLGQEDLALKSLLKAIKADAHYRDPDYLKKNNNWSNQAASDLSVLIAKLPSH